MVEVEETGAFILIYIHPTVESFHFIGYFEWFSGCFYVELKPDNTDQCVVRIVSVFFGSELVSHEGETFPYLWIGFMKCLERL